MSYSEVIISRLIPEMDFMIEGFVIMRSLQIKELFVKDYAFLSVDRRLEKLKNVLESEVIELETKAEIAAAIDEKIREVYHKGYKSFAVICKTLRECERMQGLMKSKVSIITGKESEFSEGVMLLPIYLSKGLEFDFVCIADASGENFTADPLDVKLLYIAMTRALHELVIYSAGSRAQMLK